MANLKDLLVNGSTNHVGRNYSQTPALGTKDRQVATTEFVLDNCYKPPLLSCMWADHVVNDAQWLRADTFSWQSGAVYSTVYNLLKTEVENLTKTTLYSATGTDSSVVYVAKSTGLAIGDVVYAGTANSTMHEVGTISAVSDSGFTYNNIVYTVGTATVSTNIFDVESGVYYLTTANKYKIALADQESNVLSMYNNDGVAWFYILDTTNTRFKLPRTKYGFVGLRDDVGGYVAESLPQHAHYIVSNVTQYNAALTASNYVSKIANYNGYDTYNLAGHTTPANIGLTNKAINSTYKDNAPVQQRATQMYLYFYVGEFARNSVQQTAGINSELFNGKVDLNASNLSTQGKSYISGLSMPSAKFENQTVGASGAIYVAPANGWYCGVCREGDIRLSNQSANNFGVHSPQTVWSGGKAYIPCQKGDKIAFEYAGTTKELTFYYAEGDTPAESEV